MGPDGGRKQQFEIRALDQEAQGVPPSMHRCYRGGRAAGGREESGLSLSYRSENYGLTK